MELLKRENFPLLVSTLRVMAGWSWLGESIAPTPSRTPAFQNWVLPVAPVLWPQSNDKAPIWTATSRRAVITLTG